MGYVVGADIPVYDPDGDIQHLNGIDFERIVLAGDGTVCPNDEDDEAAGWHGHIFMTWDAFAALGEEADGWDRSIGDWSASA